MLRLTPRRREVLDLIVAGLADKEIAAELGVQVTTVRTMLQTLYVDTGQAGRVRLALWYVRFQALNPDLFASKVA
jgi:DNA-binding NarL/FixJ family response regulator